MAISFSLAAQESKIPDGNEIVKQDSVKADSLMPGFRKISSSAIDQKVTYSAAGQVKRDIANKRVILIDKAIVRSEEIEITADSMIFNMSNNLLFAAGRRDTSGKMIGTPVFKEGSNEFKADELTYNFKTKKALIKNIVTKQDEGLIHSSYTKLLEDGTSNISKSSYSTCDADTPHFYINMPKARVYPGEKIISGPGNLVVEGIPLPLVIPFGYFPINTNRSSSGILFPSFGQERERGYSFKDMGYYFAISSYMDLSIKGDVYSNGTWLANAVTNYNKLYKYNGNFNFSYANNITGHKGLEDYGQSTNYRLGWAFNQDPKSSPGSRFSASVNMSSSGYDQQNSYNVNDHVTTTRQSSISYSKSWAGTPFNLSASANHSQNVKNKTVDVNLPKVSFNMGRIYPLKMKRSTGKTKWYQELQFQYSSSLDNRISTYDSLLFTGESLESMQNGFKHDAPLSIQLRPFKNFNISPSLTYSGVLYSQKIQKTFDYETSQVVKDTISGMFYGQAVNPSISAGYNPQIFGMYSFLNPNSRVQAIRHVIKPSVGFSYVPEIPGLSSDMYDTVRTDASGNRYEEYSVFEGNIYGTPSLSDKSGSFSFSLVNLVEAKVFAKNDTTGIAKKVKIIDNFGITSSYNVFADSMRWAPVSMQARTTLLENINISARANFDLYGIDSEGRSIGTFALAANNKLMRLTSVGTSLDLSLDKLLTGKKSTSSPGQPTGSQGIGFDNSRSPIGVDDYDDHDDPGGGMTDRYGYQNFDMPWTLNLSYSINYSKPSLKSTISQTLSFNGSVTITKKMLMDYTSGYDFTSKAITMTQIGIRRDLHCWIMSFNWVPNGSMKGWNFTIRAKASVLGDLKYDRRKDFHDQY
ncbi:MAG: hypothetical protein A2X04_13925 [Bacteroidetes bacterium GWF2_41_9]|nr:MAG: hypothetical protein A2X06_06730 [Bacteroidetes bacterium GWC2_40_22]OFY58427.1 MAG: hypothetical protein A2X04_13925 [Bacteroidetes bacterium GWF2_41_9]HAM10205.1 hypothetical protein [Bacteroidales bacterium]HBH82974.1 hypothetical protein [Bacteroidales bacterium]